MKSEAKTFIAHLSLFLIPLYVVIAFYVVTDPFKVLYSYPYFYKTNKIQSVGLNKDYVSTEMYLNNNPRYHYDSFIFGSSRTVAYRISDWQKHIGAGKGFHFDAGYETIYGVNRKMRFLNTREVKIKNAILVIDDELLAVTSNSKGTQSIKHPAISGQNNFLFQLEFFKTFIDYKFLTDYTYYLVSGITLGPFATLNNVLWNYDPATNEFTSPHTDSLVEFHAEEWYANHAKLFYRRDSVLKTSPVVIKKEQKVLLQEICEIWQKDSTQYKIIINPLYDQVKFNPEDKNYLDSLFGSSNVFDFSGINKITESRYNYYESSHYLPKVASYLVNEVYSAKDSISALHQ